MFNKDNIVRFLSYSWMIFVLYYILKRIHPTPDYQLIPFNIDYLIPLITSSLSLFFVLSIPSILLLLHTEKYYSPAHVFKYGAIILAASLALYFIAQNFYL